MRQIILGFLLLFAHYLSADARNFNCDASDPMFVCGLQHPEDLVHLLGTPWVIATSINFKMGNPPYDIGPGPLSAVHLHTHIVQRLYPSSDSRVDWDSKTYPDCAAPPPLFSSHGLNFRRLGEGRYRLYVANHGSRESVEIIDVAVLGAQLQATWRGCILVSVKDLGIWPNALAPLSGGGLVLAGYNIAVWLPGRGWQKFQAYKGMTPGAQDGDGFANGVEVSPDEKFIFVADTLRNQVIRFSLDGRERESVNLTFTPDNLRWGENGLLYVTGPIWPKWKHAGDDDKCFQEPICVTGIGVASIDPRTFALKDVVHNKEGVRDKFGAPTTALQVGKNLWIGTSRGNRVLIVPIDK